MEYFRYWFAPDDTVTAATPADERLPFPNYKDYDDTPVEEDDLPRWGLGPEMTTFD